MMAMVTFRGSVIVRIRAQTLIGRARSLSAGTSGAKVRSAWSPLSADPTENSVDDINLVASCHAARFDESGRNLLLSEVSDDDKIKSLASYVTTRIDESAPIPLLYGAELYVHTHHIFRNYPEIERVRIIRTVSSALRRYPELTRIQLYHADIYFRSMTYDDWEEDLTWDYITERVLYDTKLFPKFNTGDNEYEVTEETHFIKDLELDKWEFIDLIQALQMEFKLYIPYDIVDCKLAIEYIYKHRMERLSLKEFQKHVFLTGEFGESKSEFRRVFVPGIEKSRNDMVRELHCQMLGLNGFKPFKFVRNMKGWLGD